MHCNLKAAHDISPVVLQSALFLAKFVLRMRRNYFRTSDQIITSPLDTATLIFLKQSNNLATTFSRCDLDLDLWPLTFDLERLYSTLRVACSNTARNLSEIEQYELGYWPFGNQYQ